MTAGVIGRHGFARLVHAEWTKFRTVRGWVITMIAAIGATVAVGLLGSDAHCSAIVPGSPGGSACTAFPTGPGGEAVHDAFYFAHQRLTGNGTITVQMTSLTGQRADGVRDGRRGQLSPASQRPRKGHRRLEPDPRGPRCAAPVGQRRDDRAGGGPGPGRRPAGRGIGQLADRRATARPRAGPGRLTGQHPMYKLAGVTETCHNGRRAVAAVQEVSLEIGDGE